MLHYWCVHCYRPMSDYNLDTAGNWKITKHTASNTPFYVWEADRFIWVFSLMTTVKILPFGGLCFLGFGGSPWSLFPDFAERETAGASPWNIGPSRNIVWQKNEQVCVFENNSIHNSYCYIWILHMNALLCIHMAYFSWLLHFIIYM